MNRLLLPLIAALALPTDVNAEKVELNCLSDYSIINGEKIDFKAYSLTKQHYSGVDLDSGDSIVEQGVRGIYKAKTAVKNSSFLLTARQKTSLMISESTI